MAQFMALSMARVAFGKLKKTTAKVLARTLTACPRHYRFKLALRLVPFLLPLRSLRWHYRVFRGTSHLLDGRDEDVLGMILRTMNRFNIGYDPIMTVRGAESIPPQGAIVVNAHFCLNFLVSRWFLEQSRSFSAVMRSPSWHRTIPGTDLPLKGLKVDILVFEKMKRQIASGDLVVVYIDSEKPFKGSHKIETAVGSQYISANLMEFAAQADIPLIYIDVRLERRRNIVITIKRLTSTNSTELLDEFSELMKKKIEESAHY